MLTKKVVKKPSAPLTAEFSLTFSSSCPSILDGRRLDGLVREGARPEEPANERISHVNPAANEGHEQQRDDVLLGRLVAQGKLGRRRRRQVPGELALAARVLVRIDWRQLFAGASGRLERVAGGTAFRLQGRAAQREPPLLGLVLELPLPVRRRAVRHQCIQLGRTVGKLADVGRRHLQHAQEGHSRLAHRVIRGRGAHEPAARRPRSHAIDASGSHAAAEDTGHQARAREQPLEGPVLHDRVRERHHESAGPGPGQLRDLG